MSGAIEVVRHARARCMRLAVDPRDGRIRLTLPPRASLKKGLAWAEAQSGWIAAQQARLPEMRPLAPGAYFPFAGREIEIVSAPSASRTPKLEDDRLICGGPREGLERRVERWLRAEALRVLSAETAEYAARAGVIVTRVSRRGSAWPLGKLRLVGRDPLQLAADPRARFRPPRDRRARSRAPHPHESFAGLPPAGRRTLRSRSRPGRANGCAATASGLHWVGRLIA